MSEQRSAVLPDDPRSVEAASFPAQGSIEEKSRFLLNYAVLAPSILNSQPWRFRVRDNAVDLFADRALKLPVVDPAGRQVAISCGAALLNLRVAARSFGLDTDVILVPDRTTDDWLASAAIAEGPPASDTEHQLRDCILEWRTHRQSFEPGRVSREVIELLITAVRQEDSTLLVTDEPVQKVRVAEIVATAERQHLADPAYRHELDTWIRDRIASSYDRESKAERRLHRGGERHDPRAHAELSVPMGASVARSFAAPDQAAEHQADRVKASPLLALITSEGDEPRDWLAAGQGMQRMLLLATQKGLAASFQNAPTELPDLRGRLSSAFGTQDFAQALLRLGYGSERMSPAPRRAVREVLI